MQVLWGLIKTVILIANLLSAILRLEGLSGDSVLEFCPMLWSIFKCCLRPSGRNIIDLDNPSSTGVIKAGHTPVHDTRSEVKNAMW